MIETTLTHAGRHNPAGLYLAARRAPFRIHCPRQGCTFVACAERDGQAINSLVAHLLSPAHVETAKEIA